MRVCSSPRTALLLLAAASVCGLYAQTTPSLAWSSYLAGTRSDLARAAAVAADGTVWVAGTTSSVIDFPGPNDPFQNQPKGKSDVFLARFRPGAEGQATLLFWTWIGGSEDDDVSAIAVDSKGRVYLTGTTSSTDFPSLRPFQGSNGGGIDAFLAVVDPGFTGVDSVIFSSYYGGAGADVANALAIDASGSAVVVGYTTSESLPNVSGGAQGNSRGGWDSFVLRANPDGGGVQYASYLGGKSTDVATGVAVGANGVIWFSGYTASDDFPLAGNSLRTTPASQVDGFLAAIDPSRAGLEGFVYGAYFGGNGQDVPRTMRIDSAGGLWIAGYTFSTDFPVTANACQAQPGGEIDSFVLRIDPAKPAGEGITYSTYFGGSGFDILYGLAVVDASRVAISGYSLNGPLPVTGGAVQSTPSASTPDGFLAVVNTAAAEGGACLEYSTYLGGNYNDVATAVAADSSGGVYFAGYTTSTDFPVTDGSTRQNAPLFPSAVVGRLRR